MAGESHARDGSTNSPGGVLQYVHSQQPPDKEYRDDGSDDMNYPVVHCFRFSKIEHSAIVAGPRRLGRRNVAIIHR